MLIRRTSIARRVWRHFSAWGGSLLTNGENMRKQRHVLALVIGAGLTAACLLAAGPMAASDQGSWPASKVSAPTPKVASMPAALAKTLANAAGILATFGVGALTDGRAHVRTPATQ